MTIKARDLMSTQVVTVREQTTISEFLSTIEELGFSGCPVIDAHAAVVGLVSHSDVLRAVAYAVGSGKLPDDFDAKKRRAATSLLALTALHGDALHALMKAPVSLLMSQTLQSCSADTPLADLCRQMAQHKIRRVVVLDDQRHAVGVVSATDVMRHFARS